MSFGGGTSERPEEHLKVSVAMATYNGEKYIEEQLMSICQQTRKPDEIVISDDGSKDNTLSIVDRVSKCEDAQGIKFVVVTDNPRHGWGGNFAWATQHCTGDVVFFCDQDDIWVDEKVDRIVQVYEKHADALCVFSHAKLVNEKGDEIEGDFPCRVDKDLQVMEDKVIHVNPKISLERAVSQPLTQGMVMSVSKEILPQSGYPFPKTSGGHDHWCCLLSLIKDGCYYVDEVLTLYRLHGGQTCGNGAYKGRLVSRLERTKKRIKQAGKNMADLYIVGHTIKPLLEAYKLQTTSAYATTLRMIEIGEKQIEACKSGRVVGAWRLLRLFIKDIRYRRCGKEKFIVDFLYILRTQKNHRIQALLEQGIDI